MKQLLMLALVLAVWANESAGAADLSHRYPFDTDARDSAGTNHGTLTNGASIVFDPERGSVLQLDGIDDYVSLGASNVPGGPTDTATFTIAAWTKIPAGDVAREHMGGIYGEYSSYKDPGTGYPGVKNYFAVGGVIDQWNDSGRLFFSQTPPDAGDILSTGTINDGEWHHVAYVQNEGNTPNRSIYIDGVLDVSDNQPEAYGVPDPDLWAIGARLDIGSHSYSKGYVDEVRFYDGALTASEIALLVPEPCTLALLGMGAIGLLACAWRRRKRGT